MKLLGIYLMIFGGLSLLINGCIRISKVMKWRDLRSIEGGKRYSVQNRNLDWTSRLGSYCTPFLSANRQERLKKLLILSGMDSKGNLHQFLGLCTVIYTLALIILLGAGLAVLKFQAPILFFIGILPSFILFLAPIISITASRTKRSDSILQEIPLLTLCIRRELVRDSNYIAAFERAENELSGVLRQEVVLLNNYVKSTKGDIRTGLEQFRQRCGHQAIELFCMTILQGMDTDRVVDGLKDLDMQMMGILKDRVQKQTEKRNLMVFFGAMAVASIFLLQGGFYGLLKLKEQMGNLPF